MSEDNCHACSLMSFIVIREIEATLKETSTGRVCFSNFPESTALRVLTIIEKLPLIL